MYNVRRTNWCCGTVPFGRSWDWEAIMPKISVWMKCSKIPSLGWKIKVFRVENWTWHDQGCHVWRRGLKVDMIYKGGRFWKFAQMRSQCSFSAGVMWFLRPRSIIRWAAVCRTEKSGYSSNKGRPQRHKGQKICSCNLGISKATLKS